MSPEAEAEMRALKDALSKLEAQADALSPAQRGEHLKSFRAFLEAQLGSLNAKDEAVVTQFEQGTISFRQLCDHFYSRGVNIGGA